MLTQSKKTTILLISLTLSTALMSAAAIISYTNGVDNSTPSSTINNHNFVKEI